MKRIPLSQNKYALVDDEDFDFISLWQWSYHDGRAISKKIYMHRLIMCPPPGVLIDHIDMNPLNNQRANLRFATQSENARNCKARGSSGYKGVTFDKQTNKWRAQIKLNYKNIHLGRFDSAEEAYKAYCDAAPKVHGEFARV